MSEEKPLFVAVAEALGCKPVKSTYGNEWDCACPPDKETFRRPHSAHKVHEYCCHSHSGLGCDFDALADYETDFAATGPLIERYGISVYRRALGAWLNSFEGDDLPWVAEHAESDRAYRHSGETLLLAVCRTILLLHAAGKLK